MQPSADPTDNSSIPALKPLARHAQLSHYLMQEESDLWRLFAKPESLDEVAEATRLELLKTTVRLSRDSHPEVYHIAQRAADKIGLDVPVTIYQGSGDGSSNAMLYFLPDEAHVVFVGPLLERLNDDELCALLGHELSHHLLWTMDDGIHWIADRLLDANARHPQAEACHINSAERFRLYTELFADRGSAIAAGGSDPAIRCLLKTQSGLAEPDVHAYRQQVADVLKKGRWRATAERTPKDTSGCKPSIPG